MSMHIAIRFNAAVRVIGIIVAGHGVIIADLAVEIGGITVDVVRVNIAAPLVQDMPQFT